jgi:FMN phosphatase YigB (HAD superfamily)
MKKLDNCQINTLRQGQSPHKHRCLAQKLQGSVQVTSTHVVFLFDVDNTLLDSDRIVSDLKNHIEQQFGAQNRDRYFAIFEELWAELGYSDYLGALQRYRLEDTCDPRLLMLSSFLVDYPFADRLYPGTFAALAHVHPWGLTAILSDGDVVFQPRKIQRSGLWEAVEGRVLIYVHKEHMCDDIERHYPAHHYIMFDDKLRILTEMKQVWGDRLTTVWLRQGCHAHDPRTFALYPAADLAMEHIGDLINYDFPVLLGISKANHAQVSAWG